MLHIAGSVRAYSSHPLKKNKLQQFLNREGTQIQPSLFNFQLILLVLSLFIFNHLLRANFSDSCFCFIVERYTFMVVATPHR